jgi:hypothetical protein
MVGWLCGSLACDEAEASSGKGLEEKAAHLKAARKQRGRGQGKGAGASYTLAGPISSDLPHL